MRWVGALVAEDDDLVVAGLVSELVVVTQVYKVSAALTKVFVCHRQKGREEGWSIDG